MTDKVKLSNTTLERVSEAKRYATGEDTVTLDPRERLNKAGLGWTGNPEIVITCKSNRTKYGGWKTDKTRTARTNADVLVVDGEVMLAVGYGGFAFGKHGPPYGTTFSGKKQYVPKQGEEGVQDHHLLIWQADRVAKALQSHLEEQGEPVPDEKQVKQQRLRSDAKRLDNAQYHLERAVRSLNDSQNITVISLQADIDALDCDVRGHRDRLTKEADALTS